MLQTKGQKYQYISTIQKRMVRILSFLKLDELQRCILLRLTKDSLLSNLFKVIPG